METTSQQPADPSGLQRTWREKSIDFHTVDWTKCILDQLKRNEPGNLTAEEVARVRALVDRLVADYAAANGMPVADLYREVFLHQLVENVEGEYVD